VCVYGRHPVVIVLKRLGGEVSALTASATGDAAALRTVLTNLRSLATDNSNGEDFVAEALSRMASALTAPLLCVPTCPPPVPGLTRVLVQLRGKRVRWALYSQLYLCLTRTRQRSWSASRLVDNFTLITFSHPSFPFPA
jgi:hypothetical protein